jgi:hypothetical protein
MYYAARLMMPDAELNWLKQMKTRLYRAVPPKWQARPAITSLQVWALGQDLMEQVRPSIGTNLTLADARRELSLNLGDGRGQAAA